MAAALANAVRCIGIGLCLGAERLGMDLENDKDLMVFKNGFWKPSLFKDPLMTRT